MIPTCLATDSLDAVFKKLLGTRKHEIVLVDDSNRVEGIISLAEMFEKFFLQYSGV